MTSAHHPLRGVLLFTASLLLFACMDTTTKYLAARHDVPLIVAARYIGNLLLMVALLAPRHGLALVKTRRTGLAAVRALCLAVSSVLVGFADGTEAEIPLDQLTWEGRPHVKPLEPGAPA